MTRADRVLALQSAGAAAGVLVALGFAALAVDAVELRDLGRLALQVPVHLVAATPIGAAVAAALVVARWRSAGIWEGLVAVGARPSRLAAPCALGVAAVAAVVVALAGLAPVAPADHRLDGDAFVVHTTAGWVRAEVGADRLVVRTIAAPPAESGSFQGGVVLAAGLLGLGGAAAASRGTGARWVVAATVWQLGRIGVGGAVDRGAWPVGWLAVAWALAVAATVITVRDADR